MPRGPCALVARTVVPAGFETEPGFLQGTEPTASTLPGNEGRALLLAT